MDETKTSWRKLKLPKPVPEAKASTDELLQMMMRLGLEEIAKWAHASTEQVEAWRHGVEVMPGALVSLLRILCGEIPDTPNWGSWRGWRAVDGRFVPPMLDWREGSTLEDLMLVRDKKIELLKSRDKIKALEKELANTQKQRDFYHRQCIKQAQFGMVLNAFFPD